MSWRKVYHFLAVLTLLGQVLGLVFCGDADCLEGSPATDCATLVCSLLGKHTAPATTSDGDLNDDCQCFCHQLIHLPGVTPYVAPCYAAVHYPHELPHFLSTPVFSIDRPPSA